MENVKFIELDCFGELIEFAIIERAAGEFTSMLKSVWDAQQDAEAL